MTWTPERLAGLTAWVCTPILYLSVTGGCHLPDDCTLGMTRCAGDELQSCTGHPAGVVGDPTEKSSYTSGSSPTWGYRETCGAGLCVAVAESHFCALEPVPRPACAGQSTIVCDGTSPVTCHLGYAVETALCRACDPSKATSLDRGCLGGWDGTCKGDADCAPGLFCDPSGGSCKMRCACPEGQRCVSCDPLETHTSIEGVPALWVCKAGVCVY